MEREIDRGDHVVGACVVPAAEPGMDGAGACAVEVVDLAIVAMQAVRCAPRAMRSRVAVACVETSCRCVGEVARRTAGATIGDE
ncbi:MULTISPECIES: hypothetical protein [Burkholderia]|uniref:hypothetical protein n=1 Tax=Burkholderia TaxID=32008 RepID=UPI00054EA190|nr:MULTISPECIES: hypothetical protein [Burkholderia]KWE61608.1 hypothetical protein WT53_01650 [Burkholderia sp. MSMB2157WGS]